MKIVVETLLGLTTASHMYLMLVNGLACFYLLFRDSKANFNFNRLSRPATIGTVLAFLCLPIFYLLESTPTLDLCSAFYVSACKYAIHHLLTLALFGLMFQFDLCTGPSYLVQGTHGLMNFWFYNNELLTYLFCRWYICATVCCSVHLAFHTCKAETAGKTRGVLILALGLMTAIGVNNAHTGELLSLCELKNPSQSLELTLKIWTAHLMAGFVVGYFFFTHTKRSPSLPLYLKSASGSKDY